MVPPSSSAARLPDPIPREEAASTLTARDLRWLVDAYEQAQAVRVETGERLRSVLRDRGEESAEGLDVDHLLMSIRAGSTDGPIPLLGRTHRRHWEEEKELGRSMEEALQAHPAWPWLSRVRGVGTVLAAKLLSRLDLSRASSPSSFWSYCGLATVPGVEYRCATCGRRSSFPVRAQPPSAHSRPGSRTRCAGRLERHRGPDEGARVAQGRPAPGEKPSYDQYAKKVCYLIGTAFLRSRNAYGDHYRKERAKLERERPGWTEGRVHFGALRKTEKLFLAHLWTVWREAEGLEVERPYAQAVLEHGGYIPPAEMIGRPPAGR